MKRALLSLLLALGMVAGAGAQVAAPAAGAAGGPAGANAYSATVPVAGTSDAQRDAAIGSALSQVLQQVAPGFSASPDVLAKASGYVRDFRYKRAAAGGGLELQVDFDPGAIGRLTSTNPSAGNVAASGASPAAATSAATPAAAGGSKTLWVDGIGDSHAFATMLSALRGDDALHDVTPIAAEGDGVLLQLDSEQPLATVLASLSGPTGRFAANAQPHAGADASVHWNP